MITSMENVQSVIEELRQAKGEGLSYSDAKQKLLGKGFTEHQIEQASYEFTYSDVEPITDTEMTQSRSIITTGKEAELLGNRILQDKARTGRTLAYLSVIPIVLFAIQIYKSILLQKQRSTSEDRFYPSHHNTEFIMIGLVTAIAWIIFLKVGFILKDRQYKKLNDSLK